MALRGFRGFATAIQQRLRRARVRFRNSRDELPINLFARA